MSHAANEFIIRDGVFVRDFEGMYRHVEDPWDQQRNCDLDILTRSSYWFLGEVLRVRQHKLSHILDLGCGSGHCAEPLLSLGGDAAHYTGIDISETAIIRAFQHVHEAWPELTARVHFETGDIRHLNPKLVSKFSLIYCGRLFTTLARKLTYVLITLARIYLMAVYYAIPTISEMTRSRIDT